MSQPHPVARDRPGRTPAGTIAPARVLCVLAGALLVTACGHTPSHPQPTPAGTTLTAKLASPTDVTLTWHGTEPGIVARTVEYTSDPHSGYTILQFVPPGQTSYQHTQLMPQTTFYYRLRPVYGTASTPVRVLLPPGAFNDNQTANAEWAKPRARPEPGVAMTSVRDPETAAAAAPTDLKATVKDPNSILFTWTDHAADEEGYLLEDKPVGSADFAPVAVLDPGVNSVGLVTLPNEKNASYRVRAFYYGKPSNVVHETTGNDQSGN